MTVTPTLWFSWDRIEGDRSAIISLLSLRAVNHTAMGCRNVAPGVLRSVSNLEPSRRVVYSQGIIQKMKSNPGFFRFGCALIGVLATLHIQVFAQARHSVNLARLGGVDAVIEQAIADGNIPGAVLVVGHDGAVVYRKAYGSRALDPRREPMTLDTVFDLASLTKVIATTTSVMQLVEQGKVRMNDPVAKYLPEFAQNGKDDITVRQLLTHYSGLAPDLDLTTPWEDKNTAYQLAFVEPPEQTPGSGFMYSDINFIVLGALVERVSGETLDAYAAQHIFAPLK